MPATRLRRAAPTALKRLPAAARPRNRAARRALPRTCRARTSRSGTRRVALMPRRLARSSPTRARFHGQAPSSAAAAWPRPVTRPPSAKPTVSSACCGTTRSEVAAGVVAEHAAEPVARRQPRPVDHRPALGQGLTVASPRRRHDQHPRAGGVGAPAQVEVVADEADALVEAAQGAEQVGAHEQARRGHEEHVAHGVVLLLVELTRIDERGGRAELVGGVADLEDVLGRLPVDELRPDDAGVRAVGLLHQLADGVGIERHVVVEQAEEPRALHEPQGLVGCRAEAARVAERAHEGPRDPVGDAFGQVADGAGVEEEHAQVGVVLRREAVHDLLEPGTGVVGDDDGDDRRGTRCGVVHEGSRVVAAASRATAPTARRA